jgi:uncharacterized membrane protein
MNPLTSVKGTIVSGFVLAIIVAFYLSPEGSSLIQRNLSVWLHALAGVTWVGLLYYFNFVQVPAMAGFIMVPYVSGCHMVNRSVGSFIGLRLYERLPFKAWR